MRYLSFLFLYVSIINLQGQKQITLEDIWTKGTFSTKSVPGFTFMNDGKHYTRLEKNAIIKYDITNGEKVGEILSGSNITNQAGFSGTIESYELSNDEGKVLIESASESIYRHSSKADFYVYDLEKKTLAKIFDQGKIMYATFSPNGDKVAFVFENNLYYKDLKSGSKTQITLDGMRNKVINGACDWVYEEEFGFAKAFYWSPEGDRIAYIRFDESQVKEFTMTLYHDESYPTYETFKYPKVGEKNAEVSVAIYDIKKGKSKKADVGNLYDMYIPRVKWTQDNNKLCVYKMNRHQNNLELYLVNAKDGKSDIMLKEENKYYIDITDDLTFLKDKKHFIWTSEQDGYNHIYLYKMDGTLKNRITQGKYDVLKFYGVNEKEKEVYYQAAEKYPMQQNVFSIGLDGKGKKEIAALQGTNNAQFSSTYDYFVNRYSNANAPNTYTVLDKRGKVIREIEKNEKFANLQNEYGVQPVEFFSFTTSENVQLNGWMIKPKNFESTKKYPVFMTQYSGPGSQQVVDSYMGANYWWYQMLAQNGYLIACVDPRGTGARGEEFKKMTYLQLGKYEVIDQIETAKYLGNLPYVDKSRIGIFGWSYGGYMSSLCLLKGNDVFKAALAVAPVTSWKWYDSIYTERYMRTLAENKSGYEDNSPVYFADRLKGNLFLAHGLADDNVHFQNSAELANALIKANKQFDTYFYPNRNHGIYGDNARIHLYTKMTNFIYEKL